MSRPISRVQRRAAVLAEDDRFKRLADAIFGENPTAHHWEALRLARLTRQQLRRELDAMEAFAPIGSAAGKVHRLPLRVVPR
jgi:hypothetical protein